jgi:hypothetical protein
MTRAFSAALLIAMLATTPAAAARCPDGEFYRVHLHRCVGINISLAWAYVHVA